jgi:hypothetical protein
MGKMKEIYMQVMHANDGIPEDMTIEDIVQMQELKIYEWHEYEREREKRTFSNSQSEDSGEAFKMEQAERKFKGYFRDSQEERSKQ